jgi:hypothetical protein
MLFDVSTYKLFELTEKRREVSLDDCFAHYFMDLFGSHISLVVCHLTGSS